MQKSTIRTLFALGILAAIALLALMVWDQFGNDGDLFLLFALTFAFLFFLVLLLLTARPDEARLLEFRPTRGPQVRGTRSVRRVPAPARAPTPAPAPPPASRVRPRPLAQRIVQTRATPAPLAKMPPPPVKMARDVRPAGVPFVYNGYMLYSKDVELKGGGTRPFYFFSKHKPKSGELSGKPAGYHVGVNERTGLPFLKKGAGAEGEDLTPASAEDEYRPQCAALTADGAQCRNSARHDSKYCASHKGYQPPTAKGIVMRADTASKVARRDTKPSFAGDRVADTAKGSQCQALTAEGAQCRNTVIAGSQFCVKHKGRRSPTKAAVRASKDTKPAVGGARDTKVAVRKSRR